MLTKLGRTIGKLNEEFNIVLENKEPVRAKEKFEIKNVLEGINSKLENTEQISDLENRIVEITQSKQ